MLIKLINNRKYGSNNNVRNLISYLSDNILHKGQSVELTSQGVGNSIEDTLALIESDTKHKTKFDHFCLSFSPEDSKKLRENKELLPKILKDFEKNILLNGGTLDREKIAYTAFEHGDKGRTDIHFILAKQTTDGKQFDPLSFYSGSKKFTPQQVRLKAWTEKLNIENDFDIPEAQKWKIDFSKQSGKGFNKHSHVIDKVFENFAEYFTNEQSKYSNRKEFISAMEREFKGLVKFKETSSNGKFYDTGLRVILDKRLILQSLKNMNLNSEEINKGLERYEQTGKGLSNARYMKNGILNTKLCLRNEEELIDYYKNSKNEKTKLLGHYLQAKKEGNLAAMNNYKNQILSINNNKIQNINKTLSKRYKPSTRKMKNVIDINKYLKRNNNINYRINDNLFNSLKSFGSNTEEVVSEMFIWKFDPITKEWTCVTNPQYEAELKKLQAETGNMKLDTFFDKPNKINNDFNL